jgi:hypothetical protein
MSFRYNSSTKRYFNTLTRRSLSWKSIYRTSLGYEDDQKRRVREITARLASGSYTLENWTDEMRKALKDNYISQYLLGRGGRNVMNQSDWGRIGGLLSNQYRFLNNFANEIGLGQLTQAQIAARAALYIDSATQAFERAKAASWSLTLPAYPGDGSTLCMANDRCSWVIVEFDDRIEATWTLSPAEHCETCLARARDWAPLVIAK